VFKNTTVTASPVASAEASVVPELPRKFSVKFAEALLV
jgi:hypothetical protein